MAEKKKDYYKTSEAARLLDVAVSTVQLWANNGSLRAWTTDGGHRRIERSSVEEMLAQQQAVNTNLKSAISVIQNNIPKQYPNQNIIYLALSFSEARLKTKLISSIQQAHYQVQSFTSINEIQTACEKVLPTAIILDMAFNDGEFEGLKAIAQLKSNIKSCPSIFYISEYDNSEFRLAAVRAGADRYFCKPLDMKKFIHTLTSFKSTITENAKPYRVLLIDDDVLMLDLYSTILKKASFEVETLANPLDALSMLDKFNPDIIIVDVFMPECSGPELIRMIRLDDKWSLIPFIFLSGKNDIDSQLEAINLGAEDFLSKSVKNTRLIMEVTAIAKRARNNVQLNKYLKNTLMENKYQLVTLDQHALVSATDVAGRITHANKKFSEVSGYDIEELIGQNHRILKSGYHPDSFYAELWSTISRGDIWHGIVCNRKKNDREYWVDATIVPFLDDKGKPYKYVSTRTDITALRQSEERLEQSQEFAHISTWDWNISDGSLYCSDSIWSLCGYDKIMTNVTYNDFIATIYPDDLRRVENAVNSCINKNVDYDIEYRVVWPDASVHWLHAQGDVVRNKEGVAMHMLGVVKDITRAVEDKQDLIKAREEAELASRAKSQFLSSMSHELRTPMNAIIGFSQLLKMETVNPLNADQQGHVNEILVAGSHLMTLINEVLDLSKIESGCINMTIENVLLGQVVIDSLQLIMPLAQRRGINISLRKNNSDISFEILVAEKVVVKADQSRLKQVLLNLLSNAVKYNNENGKIIIACDHNDSQLRVSVTDTGDGLTEEQQTQLFKTFNRIGAEQSEIEGSGIGLVITKNIIELMGGHIGAECKPGKGCTFWFDIPLSLESVDDELKIKTAEVQPLKNNEDTDTVLYIEDNPANFKLVSGVLERMQNIQILEAHNSLLGIDLAIEYKPDLILLDINLPGMNGFDVLKQLKKQDVTNNIPVIAISANTMTEDISSGLKAGFDEYITKPIDLTALLLVVNKYLSGNKENNKNTE